MFGQCPHDVRALFSILPIALLSRQDPFPGLVLQGFVFVKLLPVSCSSTRGSRSCSSRAHIISWASSSRSISIRESTPDGAAAHRRSCGRLARRVPCRRDALARPRPSSRRSFVRGPVDSVPSTSPMAPLRTTHSPSQAMPATQSRTTTVGHWLHEWIPHRHVTTIV